MKKILILCLVSSIILAGAGFYFNHKDKQTNREAVLLNEEFFQPLEKAEKLFEQEKYATALEQYNRALKYAESNKQIIGEETLAKIEFVRATILYQEAEAVYIKYAEAVNDPQVAVLPNIAKVLTLYNKPLEILNKLQQNENAKTWNWGWRIWNDKVDPLVYQIYVYLYLINELTQQGATQENQEKIQQYDKRIREELYVQALKTAQIAVELVKDKDRQGEIIVVQNLEFLTREPIQQAQQGQGEGRQGQAQGQGGLGHLAKQRGQQGQGQGVKTLPLPLPGKKGSKGAGKANVKKGKK